MAEKSPKNKKDPIARLKLRLGISVGAVCALLIVLGAMAYASYDYWVFKLLLADNYIYTETLDELYAAHLGGAPQGGYAKNFDKMVISVVTAQIRAANSDRYTYLYMPDEYKQSKEYEKEDAKRVSLTEISPDTAVLALPNISAGTRQFVEEHKQEIAGYNNIVIDLRHNYGGLLSDGYKIAELFLPKGALIATETARSNVFTRTIKAGGEQFFSFDNIIIVQDAQTASAAESVIMALKENLDNVTIVGERSFGKGIGQVTVPLTGGFAVKATVLALSTPSGASIHGVGIEPDIEYAGGEDEAAYWLSLIEPPNNS